MIILQDAQRSSENYCASADGYYFEDTVWYAWKFKSANAD